MNVVGDLMIETSKVKFFVHWLTSMVYVISAVFEIFVMITNGFNMVLQPELVWKIYRQTEEDLTGADFCEAR
jgi:hypothetical protein